MEKLRLINDTHHSKYDEFVKYLMQDGGYWFQNDKWDVTEGNFIGKKINSLRHINYSVFKNPYLKTELKYYLLYSFKEGLLKGSYVMKLASTFKHFSSFLNERYGESRSFSELDMFSFKLKFNNYLISVGFIIKNNKINAMEMNSIPHILAFIKDAYDDREETEKDIWHPDEIKGAKVPASGAKMCVNLKLDFNGLPACYRETVKRYFRTIITRKSWSHCREILNVLNYYYRIFYSNGYRKGFQERLSREDIEKYVYWINNDFKDKNNHYRSKFLSYVRMFLDYIQLAGYEEAPEKEMAFLIYKDDTPKRDTMSKQVQTAKFIPEPIIKQLDSSVMELDRPQFIPIYILLRETGWRGTDILNLRYDNCLEQIWNGKEKQYNYYLCGEITKTGIAQLKIPIRDKVAKIVQEVISTAEELSINENNPKRYLFNIYEGRLKGKPLLKHNLVSTIQRLIKKKDIRDINGELYHFRTHSLRHTRAKEYVEQGMGISIIQQILGHLSLQMTVHYATVSENTLYEKWKATEDLELFKVNTETNELKKVKISEGNGENIIRYEYVKKNLDAVRVPFGVCFKASKVPCKQQMNHCLTCASFCTTTENIPEYEDEIAHVKRQIEISAQCGRELWADKNQQYLELLEKMLSRIKEEKIIHKNGSSREEA
jgi:integrase